MLSQMTRDSLIDQGLGDKVPDGFYMFTMFTAHDNINPLPSSLRSPATKTLVQNLNMIYDRGTPYENVNPHIPRFADRVPLLTIGGCSGNKCIFLDHTSSIGKNVIQSGFNWDIRLIGVFVPRLRITS